MSTLTPRLGLWLPAGSDPVSAGDDGLRNNFTALDTFLGNLTGMVVPYAGTAAPTGWLLCDGKAVSRSTYAALYAVCGDAYGAGDGTATFNVPNLAARVPVGLDVDGPPYDVPGVVGGNRTHTHPLRNPITRQGAGHWASDPTDVGQFPGARLRASNTVNVSPAGTQVSSAQDQYTYDTDPGDGMPPYQVLAYIIRT